MIRRRDPNQPVRCGVDRHVSDRARNVIWRADPAPRRRLSRPGPIAAGDTARLNDPVTRAGKAQAAVDVSSVIRASPDSFRVAARRGLPASPVRGRMDEDQTRRGGEDGIEEEGLRGLGVGALARSLIVEHPEWTYRLTPTRCGRRGWRAPAAAASGGRYLLPTLLLHPLREPDRIALARSEVAP